MNKNIANLILEWHGVYVSLTECIEDARVVLDQSDRGTLLPDRVREMRGQLINVQHSIPHLADLMEELIGETVWPMTVEDVGDEAAPAADEEAAAEAAHEARVHDETPPVATGGDYDAGGSTPGADEEVEEEAVVDEEAAAEEDAAEADATGTP